MPTNIIVLGESRGMGNVANSTLRFVEGMHQYHFVCLFILDEINVGHPLHSNGKQYQSVTC